MNRASVVTLLAVLAISPVVSNAAAAAPDGAGPPVAVLAHGAQSAAASVAPSQDEELVWTPVLPDGGVVFDVYAASVPPEEPVWKPDRPPQALAAIGLGVFQSDYGDTWERAERPELVRNIVVSDGARAWYAGGEEGWRSTNGARSWTRSRLRGDEPIRMLAVSPDWDVDGAVYAITANDGRLYKAEEGRSGWAETIIDAESELFTAGAAFSPVTVLDEIVFAATDQGVFKSSNNGQTWALVSDDSAPAFGPEAGSVWHQGLVISPEYGDDPDRLDDPEIPTLFAYNAAGAYRSDDDGVSWRRLELDVDVVMDLSVSPGWPRDRTLMAAVQDSSGAVAAVSEDGGVKWQMVQGRNGLTGMAVTMAPDYAPGFRGTPRNGLFIPLTFRTGTLDDLTGSYPREGSREAYLATDGAGVWRSTDAGATWSPIQAGFTGVDFSALAMLPGGVQAPVLAGTAGTGLYRSPDGGETWAAVDTDLPLGAAERVHAFAVSPAFDTDRTVFLAATSGLWASRDGGATWQRVQGVEAAPALSISPGFATDGTVWVSGARSADRGRSWEPMESTKSALALAFSPDYASDTTVWMGDAGGLAVSHDDGETWARIDDSAFRDRGVLSLTALAVRSSPDPLRVYAGTTRGIIGSTDNGEEWDRLSGTLSREVYTLQAINYLTPVGGTVLAAGDGGAGYSLNRGVDWERDDNGADPASAGTMSDDACRFVTAGQLSATWADVVLDSRCESGAWAGTP